MSEGRTLAAVAAGGAIGSLGRWLIALGADGAIWGTLLVNLTGAFVLGLLITYLNQHDAHSLVRPFATVGLLGGWTTYSSFVLDVHALGADQWLGALGYILATLLLGTLAALAGMILAEHRWAPDEETL